MTGVVQCVVRVQGLKYVQPQFACDQSIEVPCGMTMLTCTMFIVINNMICVIIYNHDEGWFLYHTQTWHATFLLVNLLLVMLRPLATGGLTLILRVQVHIWAKVQHQECF